MDSQELITLGLVGGAVLAFCWVLFSTFGSSDDTHAGEVNFSRLPWIFKITWGVAAVLDTSVGAMLAEMFPAKARKLDETAVTAALPLDAKRIFAAAATLAFFAGLVGAAVAFALGAALPPQARFYGVLAVPALAAIGWFWPGMNLAGYAAFRQEKIVREMPFAIDLIGGAMRSGLDFGAAVRYYVSLKTGTPLEEEFARVLADVTLATPFDKAIEEMAKRVRVESVASFAGVVAYSMEIGSPMAQALKSQAADLRRARFALAERKANRAPAVMIFPLVLFIMPAVFIVVLTPMFMRLSSAFAR